ncbi:MAG TPA: hypothetical protein DCL44_01810 [Elusimicrobia bacterium]|nr:hypothetical protein [Elusimicrobiota bacterium]
MSEKILIIDDAMQTAKTLQFTLDQYGYQVSVCYSGKEGLELVSREKPDIILLDVMMPDLSGFEVCKAIKQDDSTKDIPIIMLSALKEMEDKVRGLDYGADDFLTKPCRDTELVARIRAHLRAKQMHEELKKSNEELKKLGMLKDNLTQFIVHDLRNPLTSMRGWLDCLKKDKTVLVKGRQKEFIDRVIKSCDLEIDLINDLSDVTLLEESKLQLKKKPNDIRELVDYCVKQMEIDSQTHNIELKADLASDLPSVNADERLIRRVLLNLIGNSLKFTPKGGTITVAAEYSGKESRHVFTVSDTGMGIPPEYLEKIFDKFVQVEMSKETSQYNFGRGLGLTFCKLAVESHGGVIHAESELGAGTKISFTLPKT